MTKRFLSAICIAAACASASAAIPTIDEITGSYIQSDSTIYADSETGAQQVQWSQCNDLTIERVEGSDNKIEISGYWRSRNGVRHTFEASYNATLGRISIPAGSVLWIDNVYPGGGTPVQSEIKLYNYEQDPTTGNWGLSQRDIIFIYDDDKDCFVHSGYTAITTQWPNDQTGEMEEIIPENPVYNTTLLPANGTVANHSYGFEAAKTDEETGEIISYNLIDYGEESRPCYVDYATGTILNLLKNDMYGHGAMAQFAADDNIFIIPAQAIGAVTSGLDYDYRVLAAATLDPDTHYPMLSDETQDWHLATYATPNSDGTMHVSMPTSAIFAAAYDETTGQLQVDGNAVFEMLEKLEITFTPNGDATSAIDEVTTDGMENRTVASEEYFDLQGRRITTPVAAGIVIKKTTYTDGTTQSTKQLTTGK